MKYLALAAFMLMSAPAISFAMAIEMLSQGSDDNNMVFSKEIPRIDTVDTITRVLTNEGYNIKMIASPNGMRLKSMNGREAHVNFDALGVYHYWCTPHKGIEIVGLVVVGGATSGKDQIAKVDTMGKSKKKLKRLLSEL